MKREQFKVTGLVKLIQGMSFDMHPDGFLVEGPGRSHYIVEPVEYQKEDIEEDATSNTGNGASESEQDLEDEEDVEEVVEDAPKKDLTDLTYRELQKLTGSYEVKGNLPKKEMVEALKEAMDNE